MCFRVGGTHSDHFSIGLTSSICPHTHFWRRIGEEKVTQYIAG
jgi:hypothetical protein